LSELDLNWLHLDSGEQDFLACIDDLIFHPYIQSMNQFRHHKSATCLDHSLHVSYFSYTLCKALGWDYKSAARGGLLHDLFLYDWRTARLEEGRHGFVHPRIALDNACSIATVNEVERDIILKHMFPLTWRPPAYKESMLVCLVDKYCAVREMVRPHGRKRRSFIRRFLYHRPGGHSLL